jgi:phage terminase large subunit-like protein
VFSRKISPDTREGLPNPENFARLQMNPAHNLENLPEGYITELAGLPERHRRRFLYGLPSNDLDGALWTLEGLDAGRILDDEIPDMQRIIISIDPSGCAGEEDERSDEVGIIVLALGVDGRCYVLEDLSGRHGPQGWGKLAVATFERWDADAIIAEVNFGGAMVKEVIRAACVEAKRPMVPFRMVRASRGKVVRAEPVATLYGGTDTITGLPKIGKVCHVGRFPLLEDQLCGFTVAGYAGEKSPDRADALVWGVHELFPALTRSKGRKGKPEPDTRVGGAHGWLG